MSADAVLQMAQTALRDDAAQLAYYGSPLPSPKDDEITRLVEGYLAADPAGRLKIATGLSDTQANWLGTYAHRLALLAARRQSPADLKHAIVALLMAAKITDWRDSIMTMAVLYRAAQLLGVGDQAFLDAAPEAPDPAAGTQLLDFLDRPDPDKTIESMGYRELSGKNGVIIVYGSQPVPAGFL
jgi:hypothetical protein